VWVAVIAQEESDRITTSERKNRAGTRRERIRDRGYDEIDTTRGLPLPYMGLFENYTREITLEFLCFDCVLLVTARLPDWKCTRTCRYRYRYPIRTSISTLEVFVSLDEIRIAFRIIICNSRAALEQSPHDGHVATQTKIKIARSQCRIDNVIGIRRIKNIN
jgi:hypothetical protein